MVRILLTASCLIADFMMFGGRTLVIPASIMSKACFLNSVVESMSLFFIIMVIYLPNKTWVVALYVADDYITGKLMCVASVKVYLMNTFGTIWNGKYPVLRLRLYVSYPFSYLATTLVFSPPLSL